MFSCDTVLCTALSLIRKELSFLRISSDTLMLQSLSRSPAAAPSQAMPAVTQPGAMTTEPLQQQPWLSDWTQQPMVTNPDLYQAMSSLEPLSVKVVALHESGG